MAVSVDALKQALVSVMQAQRRVADKHAMAVLWAPVYRDVFLAVSTPPGIPGARQAAVAAAHDAAVGILTASTRLTALADHGNVAATFALAVVGTTIGAPPAVAVPPPALWVPVGVLGGIDASAGVFAAAFIAWILTGNFTVPPSSPVPWS